MQKGLIIILLMCFWQNPVTLPISNLLHVDGIASEPNFEEYYSRFEKELKDKTLNRNALYHALNGYLILLQQDSLQKSRYLTIMDISKSANEERFYVIDMKLNQVVHKTLAAHGKNSGEEYATSFSNESESYKSSLGFYLTAETYVGKHGLSLRLDGLEFSNFNARERAIVIHQADYVSSNFIEENNRLGRSFGCPALPKEGYFDIISKIRNKSCFFIYFPDSEYMEKSVLVRRTVNLDATVE